MFHKLLELRVPPPDFDFVVDNFVFNNYVDKILIGLFIRFNTDGVVHVVLACISHWNNIHLVASLSKPFCLANLIYCSRTIVIVVRSFSRLLFLIRNWNLCYIIFFNCLLFLFIFWFPSFWLLSFWFPSFFINLFFYLVDLFFMLLINFFELLFYIRLLLFRFSALLFLQLVFLLFFIKLLISYLNYLFRLHIRFFNVILSLLCRLHIGSLLLIFFSLLIGGTLIGIDYVFALVYTHSVTARLLLYRMHCIKCRWFYNRLP
jgi:hypothetical protein